MSWEESSSHNSSLFYHSPSWAPHWHKTVGVWVTIAIAEQMQTVSQHMRRCFKFTLNLVSILQFTHYHTLRMGRMVTQTWRSQGCHRHIRADVHSPYISCCVTHSKTASTGLIAGKKNMIPHKKLLIFIPEPCWITVRKNESYNSSCLSPQKWWCLLRITGCTEHFW